jgi:hypothetical protein
VSDLIRVILLANQQIFEFAIANVDSNGQDLCASAVVLLVVLIRLVFIFKLRLLVMKLFFLLLLQQALSVFVV